MADNENNSIPPVTAFDPQVTFGGIYANDVHAWFGRHEITLDFLTHPIDPPDEVPAEATVAARIKVTPSALEPMIRRIIEVHEAWLQLANDALIPAILGIDYDTGGSADDR